MAKRLLEEARGQAARWSDYVNEQTYSRELLRLDPEIVSRLEREIAESLGSSPETGPSAAPEEGTGP
jgi:hypothetical protein